MRNKRAFLGAALVTMMLAGCSGGDSDVMPDDAPSGTIPLNSNENVYKGRAADGYLRDAFVWLDIDNDLLWDEGEEPSTLTTSGGHFSFDLTAINEQRRASNQRVIDPREYSLMLMAIPGQTIDEGDGSEEIIVDKSFFLMAPPDTNFISPLTTLVKIRLDLGIFLPSSSDGYVYATNAAHNALSGILGTDANYLKNYLTADDAQLAVYADAVVALIKSHTTDAIDQLMQENGQGYARDEINVIGRNVLKLMPDVVATIEAQHEQGTAYQDISISQLELPLSDIDLADPYVVVKEVTYKNPQLQDGEEPVKNPAAISSEVVYEYSTNGVLNGLSVDGYRSLTPDGIGVELRQFWYAEGPEGIAEQRFSYGWDNGKISAVTLDSIHHLDNNPSLTKPLAAESTVNSPEEYGFGGEPEATLSNVYENGVLVTTNLIDKSGAKQQRYQYDEKNRLVRKEYYVNTNGSFALDSYVEYEYGEQNEDGSWSLTREIKRDEVANIAYRMSLYEAGEGDPTLTGQQEFYFTSIDVGGVQKTVINYVFIIDNITEFNAYKYTRVDYFYMNAIDVLADEGGDFVGLDPASSEDLAVARSRVQDKKLLEKEGLTLGWVFSEAKNNSEPGRGLAFAENVYQYEILSEYIVSGLLQ